jgi:hypothetical protein
MLTRGPKSGLSAGVSERVLISLAPMLGFFAQLGTRPQRRARNFRVPLDPVATA